MQAELQTPSRLEDYWRESPRPLTSLLFVAPLLLVYETGTILLGAGATRNGVDIWLRELLSLIGFGQYLLLPLLTCGLLLAWHHTRREPWRLQPPRIVAGMLVESLLLGYVLILVVQFQHSVLAGELGIFTSGRSRSDLLSRLVGYCGAGIYEELLFRLMMLPAALVVLRSLGLTRSQSAGWAIVLTSLCFAVSHYDLVIPGGDVFDWPSFAFRFCAGVFFSLLFILRGFGIAVGTHACYDVYVAVAC